jgi:hypothetical protein
MPSDPEAGRFFNRSRSGRAEVADNGLVLSHLAAASSSVGAPQALNFLHFLPRITHRFHSGNRREPSGRTEKGTNCNGSRGVWPHFSCSTGGCRLLKPPKLARLRGLVRQAPDESCAPFTGMLCEIAQVAGSATAGYAPRLNAESS